MPISKIRELKVNNKLVFLSNTKNSFCDNLKKEAEPKELCLIQLNELEHPYISKKFHKNICIPDIKLLSDISIPPEYRFIDHLCCTNDLISSILDNQNLEHFKLNYKWNPIDHEIQINNTYKNMFKYGAVFNYRDDQVILQDLLYVFYEATKNTDNVILLLYVSHESNKEVVEDIKNLHNRLNIKPHQSKILLYTQQSFDDISKMSLINICDCMMLFNSISIDELIYNHTLFKNKTLMSKYKLYNSNHNIKILNTTKKMIKYKGKRRFYEHIDIHNLYTYLTTINHDNGMQIMMNHQPPQSTNISAILC